MPSSKAYPIGSKTSPSLRWFINSELVHIYKTITKTIQKLIKIHRKLVRMKIKKYLISVTYHLFSFQSNWLPIKSNHLNWYQPIDRFKTFWPNLVLLYTHDRSKNLVKRAKQYGWFYSHTLFYSLHIFSKHTLHLNY